MLLQIKDVQQLKFSPLMDIYAESNYRMAEVKFPNLSANEALFAVENDFYSYLKFDFLTVSGAAISVWEEQGKWVSALRMEPYMDGMLLAGLETHPSHRSKGFAALLVRNTLRRLLPGTKVYSHVSRNNPASLKVHRNCGFVKLLSYATYIDGSVDEYSDTLIYTC